jgi:hypothetical protein
VRTILKLHSLGISPTDWAMSFGCSRRSPYTKPPTSYAFRSAPYSEKGERWAVYVVERGLARAVIVQIGQPRFPVPTRLAVLKPLPRQGRSWHLIQVNALCCHRG